MVCFWHWLTDHATVLATGASAFGGLIVAAFTIVLARSTHLLVRAGQKQQEIIERQNVIIAEQKAIAHQEFMTTHRPRVRVIDAHLLTTGDAETSR